MHVRPLKVLHLISSRGLYGAERIVLNLTAAVDRRRFTSHLALLQTEAYPNSDFIRAAEEKGAATHIIPCRRWVDPEALRRTQQVIKEKGIDIVHCHEMKGRLYGLFAAKGTPARLITTNHNWIRSGFLVACFETLDAFYIRFFPKIVAVSREVHQVMRCYFISSEKIRVVINGINMHEFQRDKSAGEKIRKKFGLDEDVPLIGAVGRVSPEKGHKYFITAAGEVLASFPRARFIIVGEGFQSEEMKIHAARLGIRDRIIFSGFSENIAACYSALDVFVLPSLIEGTPMALLEAMSAELPVIASRVGGIERIIRNEENGLLVSPANAQEAAAAIIRLLQDPVKGKKMAKNAWETVAERYSARKMTDAYMKLYTELAAERK